MINYRKIHKERLQAYLASIIYDNAELPVFSQASQFDSYPHIFITSNSLEFQGSQNIVDSVTNVINYEYSINLIFKIGSIEENIDELEYLILEKLLDIKTKNNDGFIQSLWLDLVVKRVSPVFSGSKLQMTDEHFVKEFIIEIQQVIE